MIKWFRTWRYRRMIKRYGCDPQIYAYMYESKEGQK